MQWVHLVQASYLRYAYKMKTHTQAPLLILAYFFTYGRADKVHQKFDNMPYVSAVPFFLATPTTCETDENAGWYLLVLEKVAGVSVLLLAAQYCSALLLPARQRKKKEKNDIFMTNYSLLRYILAYQ